VLGQPSWAGDVVFSTPTTHSGSGARSEAQGTTERSAQYCSTVWRSGNASRNPVSTERLTSLLLRGLSLMQNTISTLIALAGLGLALLGGWLLWGPLSVLIIIGGALFTFGLVTID